MAERRRLDEAIDRRIFFEGQMRTALSVALEIVFHDPAEPSLMEDDDEERERLRVPSDATNRVSNGIMLLSRLLWTVRELERSALA